MSQQQRFIAHLDMDAFYASVELLRYPQLKGMPVVIGGRKHIQESFNPDLPLEQWPRLRSYAGRGVVTTATYEARALGVHSAMGIMKAQNLAPDAILLPANFESYRHYSRLFKKTVQEIAPLIEDRGIDEIYIDLSNLPNIDESTPEEPMLGAGKVAHQIQKAIFDVTGLTCSIGISPNKLLSKLCSDLDKPNGITLLRAQDIAPRIWPLPVELINGIGPRAKQKLHALDIYTIGELAHAPIALLIDTFGSRFAQWLHQSAHGIDERPVEIEKKTKSISREVTFENDLHVNHDKQQLGKIFTDLCYRVANDLQIKGYVGRNISIKVRFDNFETITRALTLPTYIQDGASIRRLAGQCLKRIHFHRKIRLLGIGMSQLLPYADYMRYEEENAVGQSLPLF